MSKQKKAPIKKTKVQYLPTNDPVRTFLIRFADNLGVTTLKADYFEVDYDYKTDQESTLAIFWLGDLKVAAYLGWIEIRELDEETIAQLKKPTDQLDDMGNHLNKQLHEMQSVYKPMSSV